ncbi:MAG: molecular chaperone HtpG [Bacillota bacterium]
MNVTAAAPQRMEFKTELKQLLDLIIHSLYTKKEVFLRELISNAADAIDRVRFEGLTKPEVLENNGNWKIKLIPNEAAGTLTISDNGVGMSRESIVETLGTIAKSGTRQFLESLKQADVKNRPELIGQFGVGFYASFMVADKVTVLSRIAGGKSDGVKWESDGQGEYTLTPFEKETRGTDVILHLREDAKEFLSSWRLREIVKRYSDYIEHPIAMDVEKEKGKKEEEVLNSRQAIWLRSKNEIKDEEYKAFYKQISLDDADPLKTIHVAAEGTMEFRALMFIPSHRGYDWLMGPEKKSSLDLYVRRVLIQHECEQLVPPYLRFVKGLVDSSDLPLNVSRETLQYNPLLPKIKSNLVNRILKVLEETRSSEYETYLKFFKEFQVYLKEGAAQDWANQQRLVDLLLFESTKTDPKDDKTRYTTLAKYVEKMPADQKEIYYLIGESREMIENSPYVEAFKAKGQEVLLLTEPVDEFLMSSLQNYKDKPFKAVDRGQIEVDKSAQEQLKAAQEKYKPLLEVIQRKLDGQVKEVRLSSRLKDSAAVLVVDEHAPSAHLERLLQRMGRNEETQPSKRILELNAEHPAIKALHDLHQQNAADSRLDAYTWLLYDQAVIAEGSRIQDPTGFAKRLNDLIAREASRS